MPESYEALRTKATGDGTRTGATLLERRLLNTHIEIFGVDLAAADEEALDDIVVMYAGKIFALKLIGPAIDYWSKQITQQTATGRNESRAYKDRAADLKELASRLTVETSQLWEDVVDLIPSRRVKTIANVPVVADIGSGIVTTPTTPDPNALEPPFAPPA
jgi:hypothetical protein